MTARRALSLARLTLLACAALASIGGPPSALAHEFTMESLMNGFVKIDPTEAHLVVRVPLHVIRSAKFPTTGREIDLPGADAAVQRALAQLGRDITIWEDGRPLVPASAVGRLTLPSDRSFDRYEDAVTQTARPVAPGTTIYADQGYLDAHLTYRIASPKSRFAIRTAVGPEFKDYLKLAVRYLPFGEEGRPMLITSSSGRVDLNPTWYRAAGGFVALGIAHILTGVDHMLFLACLIIPVSGLWQVLPIVTAFTVGHSITLLGSAYNLAPEGSWFPPLVETLIALSIVYMALENIIGANLRRRWLIAALFGLVHGFGFSYGLKENLQFAGRHLLVSLFSFNVGIEIGQILVLAVMLPALVVLLRYVLVGRVGMIIVSAIVAHVGWHWMSERAEVLWQAEWPQPDAAGLAIFARWAAALLLGVGIATYLARRARFGQQPALEGGQLPGRD
jgi:hypothetical protein